MAQYIDKSAVVAEIKRRRDKYINLFLADEVHALSDILEFIDTLDVKEVDLEKELDVIIDSLNDDKYEHLSIHQQLSHIARHFYELGLKAQTNIKMPNLEDIFIENGIDPNSKQAKIFKESYYTALGKLKAQKGE